MKTIRSALAAAALAAALTSCASGGTPTAAAAPPAAGSSAAAPSGAATGEESEVESVFRDYYQALLARDFPTACALNAPETNAKLIANLEAGGATVASCEEALSSIYAIPGAGAAADGIAKSAQIQGITVTGDTASVTWSAEVEGKRPTVTNGLRRIDGQWRLLDVRP